MEAFTDGEPSEGWSHQQSDLAVPETMVRASKSAISRSQVVGTG